MRPNREQFYKRLIEYHRAHPESNNADIGRIFKCTRERVRQILRDQMKEVKS
jgi:DNA-directed RNA polymerase sigma subunit (sigma70/sigma32)